MTPEQERLVTDKFKSIEGVKIPNAMYSAIKRDIAERGMERPTDAAVVTAFTLPEGAGTTRTITNVDTGAVIAVPLDRYYALRDILRANNRNDSDASILKLYEKER